MASNIFNTEDYQGIIARIKSLDDQNSRRWGSMDLNQMLEHCCIQLKLGLGKIKQPNVEGPSIMRTGLGRWVSLYGSPWIRGLPTPSKMNLKANKVSAVDLESEKTQLLSLLVEVQGSTDLDPHPFFGPLSRKDWGRLIWKHIDYHLRQFGA